MEKGFAEACFEPGCDIPTRSTSGCAARCCCLAIQPSKPIGYTELKFKEQRWKKHSWLSKRPKTKSPACTILGDLHTIWVQKTKSLFSSQNSSTNTSALALSLQSLSLHNFPPSPNTRQAALCIPRAAAGPSRSISPALAFLSMQSPSCPGSSLPPKGSPAKWKSLLGCAGSLSFPNTSKTEGQGWMQVC